MRALKQLHLEGNLLPLPSHILKDSGNVSAVREAIRRREAVRAGLSDTEARGSTERYDVALSFAGEDRLHAEHIAALLSNNSVRVFYDRYEQADLWGKDLYAHLHEVYSKRATFCVIFCSRAYAERLWTNHERRAAQERAFKSVAVEYILPIRIDDTEIPGLPSTVGYIHISEGPERISELILEKLTKVVLDPGAPPTQTPL